MGNISSDIQGQGRPDFNLPYRTGTHERPLSLPRAPKNLDVTSPYLIGILDLRWDNPADYFENNGLRVLGVNLYRTFDSPEIGYVKINDNPISSLYYRDETREIRVEGEDALSRLDPGNNPRKEWVIKAGNSPIVIPGTQGQSTNSVDDVIVEIDDGSGYQVVRALKVRGDAGEILLNTNRIYDAAQNKFLDPVLPDLLNGGIRITYSHVTLNIATNINRKIYYKATTVAFDEDKGVTIETPLEEVEAKSPYDMEKIDYIWAEGIRRNHWILDQAGERVKLFLRKWNGTQCECYDEKTGYSKRIGVRNGGCPYCYGTGYVGGYEGPYDIMIAPPETEKAVNLLETALHITYDWNSWTGPHPLLNDRDVIVRQNNDRFFVSRANYQGSRGATYQQHFNLTAVDTTDPIYNIPIIGGELGVPPAWNAYREGQPSDASPQIPDKPEVAPGKKTGRTVTFENIMY
jgi:hypothetical protein